MNILENINLTDKIYTPDEVAAILKIPKSTVCYLLRNRELKGAKIGRQWRISKKQLEIFIEDNTTN